MNLLTRSQGSDEDCEPIEGYFKSKRDEIYRCESGNDENGVMAFTEATYDNEFDCGLDDSYLNTFWNYNFDIGYPNPLTLVSKPIVSSFVSNS